MKILITGGAGFLGFHLIKKLLKLKHQLIILDRNDLPEKNLKQKLQYIQGDVRDQQLMIDISREVDVIIHAAASLPLERPADIKSTTIEGTRNVLIASKKNKIPRVVYVSSTAVYGVPEKHPIIETDPLIGVGPYGEAKIAAEQLCTQSRSKTLTVAIVRPKTFIGTERLGVFQILFNWVRLGKRIPIIGNGHNRYQLLEVEDLVSAILLVATAPPNKANDIFNVGAQKFDTVQQDIQALCDYAGTGSKPLPVPSIVVKPALRLLEAVHLSPLYRWVYDTADKDSFVSTKKIEKLGWKASRSNAESLINAYQWYLNNYQHIEGQSGTTHRVGWDQGFLQIIRKFL